MTLLSTPPELGLTSLVAEGGKQNGAVGSDQTVAGSPSILVVDDQELVRRLAQTLLGRLGYHVLVAADAEQALAIARSETAVDLLITDVVMPDSDGFELADRFLVASPRTRVIFMSGHATDRTVDPGILDSLGILRKPFTTDAFAARVRTTLAAPSPSEARA